MTVNKTKKDRHARKSEKPVAETQKCSLSFAIDHENGGRKVSVAGAISGIDYTCPFCQAMVYKRTGPVRRHHFAHYPGSSCSYSGESDLHYGAKYYLCEKLRANARLEIEVPVEIVPDSYLKKILERACATSYKIPVSSFFENILVEHQVEKYIEKYEPDVLSTNSGKPVMAWEICHTSPMHDEKIRFFEDRQIPFIELEACEAGKEDYSFKVRNPGNTKLFAPENFSLKSLKYIFAEELQTDIASDVLSYFFDHYQEILNTKLFGDLNWLYEAGIPLNNMLPDVPKPFDIMVRFMKEAGSLTIKQTILKNFGDDVNISAINTIEEYEDLIKVDLVQSKLGNFVVTLNDKFMDSSLNLCGEIFRQFSDKFPIMAAINDENEIVSLKTSFVVRDLRICELTLENYSETNPTQFINLSFLNFGKDDRGKPCYLISPDQSVLEEIGEDVPKAVLADPTHICYRFIKDLREVCDLKVISGKGKNGKKYVIGLQINGLYSENGFNRLISESLMQGFKKILFWNPFQQIKEQTSRSTQEKP